MSALMTGVVGMVAGVVLGVVALKRSDRFRDQGGEPLGCFMLLAAIFLTVAGIFLVLASAVSSPG